MSRGYFAGLTLFLNISFTACASLLDPDQFAMPDYDRAFIGETWENDITNPWGGLTLQLIREAECARMDSLSLNGRGKYIGSLSDAGFLGSGATLGPVKRTVDDGFKLLDRENPDSFIRQLTSPAQADMGWMPASTMQKEHAAMNSERFALVSVPEPSAGALMILGAAMLFGRVRSKR